MEGVQLDGGCSCGAIRYECHAAPLFAFRCHCRDCQRTSGSGFIGVIWVRSETIRVTGDLKTHAFAAASGRELNRGFCPRCGSNVLLRSTEVPHMTQIVASSLDDPSQFQPTAELWTSRAQPWDHIDDRLTAFETQPSDEEVMKLLGIWPGDRRF